MVRECPAGHFPEGTVVATAMVVWDASWTVALLSIPVPASRVQVLDTTLSWETIGAAPEMLQTAYGSLFKSVKLQKGDRLLVRGGTTSVGLATAAIVRSHGCQVARSTRQPNADTVRAIKE